VRLSHFAEVQAIYHIEKLFGALLLDDLHCWSEETVRQRFAYRTPGIYVLAVRLYAIPQPHELAERAEYAGCRTWLDLGRELPTESARPVLSDDAFEDLLLSLTRRLNPTAMA